ncbi:MAG: phosphatase PAP2 family protein [Anaerobutyricum hallii]
MDLILCNVILKPLVARIRPFDVNTAIQLIIAKPQDYSFPSGHTAASCCIGSGALFSGEKGLWRDCACYSLFIASFSRMYLYASLSNQNDFSCGAVVGVIPGLYRV